MPHGRYERTRIAGGPTVIYDAYNASMSGALATLAAFARERAPARRIVVFGQHGGTGRGSTADAPDASALPRPLRPTSSWSAARLRARSPTERARAGLAADALIAYQTNDEAIAWLREHARPDDVVLLKGSRMYRMEQIVAGLSA